MKKALHETDIICFIQCLFCDAEEVLVDEVKTGSYSSSLRMIFSYKNEYV